MLMRLLRSHLRPYRRALYLIVALQTIQTSAALTLPTINARIVDNGILKGDTTYIWHMGAFMLAFSLIQNTFSIGAVYLGGRVAMGFSRDLRNSLFHQVTSYSA